MVNPELVEVTEGVLDGIRVAMRGGAARAPSTHDKVYKDECMFSFDTPLSAGGLYVNLRTWQGFGAGSVALDKAKQGALYLHQIWKRVPKPSDPMDTDDNQGATRLAIGVHGGFLTDAQRFDLVKEHALALYDTATQQLIRVPYPDAQDRYPTVVCQAADAVIAHQGAAEQAEVTSWEAEQELPVSKYAENLPFEDNGTRISNDPKTWRCADSGQTDNLWLNLSTGHIGSGRRNWDGTGGTGAALKHYEDTGRKYPLAVKLGTITPQGADVYSYAPDEDGMVKDPKLAEHLRRWGVDVMSLEKTDKTLAELEVELNKSYDFSKITEAGKKLTPLYGPGYTGLKNLGNSCYMNSCLQLLCALPEVKQRYSDGSAQKIFEAAPADPAGDFITQMAKVTNGLWSGEYSKPPPAGESVEVSGTEPKPEPKTELIETGSVEEAAPRMFRHLVGKGHSEFSTGRQQDALEYIQHLLEFIRRAEHQQQANSSGSSATTATALPSTASLFQYTVETRTECLRSHTVRYSTGPKESVVTLQIPLEAATNQAEVEAYKERVRVNKKQKTSNDTTSTTDEEEEVKPAIPLWACMQRFVGTSDIEDFRSPAVADNSTGRASVSRLFASFPRYLVLHMCRYYVDDKWQPQKLEVEIDVPQSLDISSLRKTGIQPGEQPMPESTDTASTAPAAAPAAAAAVVPDDMIVAQLLGMDIPMNAAQRAAIAVNNASADAALDWAYNHMGDADFDAPLITAATTTPAATGAATDTVDAGAVETLVGFGFTSKQATAALTVCGGDAARAADWLFNHMDDIDSAVNDVLNASATGGAGGSSSNTAAAGASTTTEPLDDGEGKYTLVGFISHVGRSTAGGHYVAHIKKEGRWVIHDDQKVAASEATPLKLGYIYLYRRDDAPESL